MSVNSNNSEFLNDSWDINKTPRHIIQKQTERYANNREELLAKSRQRYWENLETKRKYDKMYYLWRKSWGEYNCRNTWNLLRISGDVFQ